MFSNPSKSVSLFAFVLVGLASQVSLSGCVAPSAEGSCERGERGAAVDEGACDEGELEGESADRDANQDENMASPTQPSVTPQAICSPFCDRI